MLRFITQKLRNQSLNEVRPIDNQGSWLTEHLEEIENRGGVDTSRDVSTLNDSDYGNGNNNNYPSLIHENASIEPQLKELRPERYSENGVPNVPVVTLAPRFDIFPDQAHKEKEFCEDTKGEETKENLPCILPLLDLPSRRYAQSSDRRKLNDVKRRKAESSSDSSSSDDEIKELCSHGIPKYRLSSSRPPDKIPAVSSSFVICQRRRSRGVSPRFQSIQRPSINFERMQQTIMLRRQRNRVVRVRTLPSVQSGGRPYDPSMLGFKPIANLNPCINHLAPVEDPLAF